MSTFLIGAVDAEMRSRGFQRSSDPDLLVNFHLLTQEMVAVGPSGPARRQSGRYRQRRREATPMTYTEGTLGINLLDTRGDLIVWEGLAQGSLHAGAKELTPERTRDTVRRIFERFTHSVD